MGGGHREGDRGRVSARAQGPAALLPSQGTPSHHCPSSASLPGEAGGQNSGREQPGSPGILQAWRPATPTMPTDPSESHQTACLRSPCFSTHFQINKGVPAALPCPPAASPNLLSPLPNSCPTLLQSNMVLPEPSVPTLLLLCWAEGQRVLSSPSPCECLLRTDDTRPRGLQLCHQLCSGTLSFFRVT